MQTLAQQKQQTTAAAIVAFVLWALTAVLGILTIVYMRAVVLRTYLRFVPDGFNALSLLNILTLLPMAFVFVAAVIGGAEYHRTHYGSPESWRLFARVLALEVGILILPLFL